MNQHEARLYFQGTSQITGEMMSVFQGYISRLLHINNFDIQQKLRILTLFFFSILTIMVAQSLNNMVDTINQSLAMFTVDEV